MAQANPSGAADEIGKAYALFQMGAIDAAEYAKLKSAALQEAGPVQPAEPGIGLAGVLGGLEAQIKGLAGNVAVLASALPKSYAGELPGHQVVEVQAALHTPNNKRRRAEEGKTGGVKVLPGQMSLFEAGVTSELTLPNGRVASVKEAFPRAETVLRNKTLQCRWCDRLFSHGPARASHEKIHSGPMRGQFALSEVRSIRSALGEAAKNAEIEKQVRWTINDLITEMIRIGKEKNDPAFVNFGGRLKDGRSNNQGSTLRQGRSPHFKLKVLDEYERLINQFPAFRGDIAMMVADSFRVSNNQVYTWYRERAKIQGQATKRASRHMQRRRQPRGKFHEAEADVFAEFKEMRTKGKRVGPHWLKRAMLRTVRKKYVGTELGALAKLFKACDGWRSRFCKRWRISLRCKTNVKRIPIELRIGKLKRYFACFRLRLKADEGKRGYDPRWGLYKPRNRWNVDQVPAGFFCPGRTYEHKGAKRVLISANEAADDHRECTLQVLAASLRLP